MMAKNFGFGGLDPMTLMMSPDIGGGPLSSRTTTPMQPPGSDPFDMGADGWQRIMMGLALMDASKPRVNPPPLGETIAPFMKLMAAQKALTRQQELERAQFGLAHNLATGGPDISALLGGDAAEPAPASGVMPTPMSGNAGMVPGGALPRAAASAGQYEPLIQSAAAQYGIPADILRSQLRVESNFDPNAVSPAGAQGIAQFMPATAQRFGIDPRDPRQAIPASAKYTASNRDMFGGNLGLGLAGYNWGEGNVQKWLARGADPAAVPTETRKYVQNITGQPIEAWARQGGGGAPDTVVPSPDAGQMPMRNVADVGAPQPTQRDLAQARAYMPTTQPPPSPDQVRGQRTQAAVAAQSFQYWSRALVAAGMLGEPGKGIVEAAKAQIDLAKGFLTPTEMQRNAAAAFPGDKAAQARALRMALPNSPEGAFSSELAKRSAGLQTLPAEERIKADEAIRQAQGVPTTEKKEYDDYVADATSRGQAPLSIFEWGQQRRRAQNQAEFGSIPPGYRMQRGADGSVSMMPIPGSPTEKKAELEQAQRRQTSNIVIQEANRAEKLISDATLPTTGLGGNLLKNLPGTASHDLSNLLNTMKANSSFDKLQEMRASSPTGGALGPVSDFENRMLQATIGSLEQSQTQEQFLFNLRRVKDVYLDIIDGPRGPHRMGMQPPEPSAPITTPYGTIRPVQ